MTMTFEPTGLRLDAPPPGSGSHAEASRPVASGRLDNGMEVVVIPDPRSPIAAHMVWYRNGAADDLFGKSGTAHFLEHLMFKGTALHPAEHFSRHLAAVGGEENAFTSWAYTSYFQRVPVEHLETCMVYEADRMTNLVLTEGQVNAERQVVLEERAMITDSDPERLLQEAVHHHAFSTQPWGRPIIGWRHEIEGLGIDDALAYYRRFYRPDNAVLVVAGDVEFETVMALARRHYGAIRRTDAAPERLKGGEIPARVSRQITLADESVHQPLLQRVYVVPSPRVSGLGEALEVLSRLLGGGSTSLLYRRIVVEAGLATSVDVSYWGTILNGQTRFDIDLCPAAGVSLEQLAAALDACLADLVRTGFEERDVERAKTHIVAQTIYGQDSHAMLAQRYGAALCCGLTVEDVALWPARIRAVDAPSLHRALLQLDPLACVVGHLTLSASAQSS